jgi:hypothetical protein
MDIKGAVSRFMISLAQKHVADSLISDLTNYLAEATPEEILEYSMNGKLLEDLADEATKKKYMDRLKGARIASDKLGNTEFIRKKVQEIDFKTLLKGIHEKALEMAEDGDKRALENFGFIINNPTVLRWLKLNFDTSKEKVLEAFS